MLPVCGIFILFDKVVELVGGGSVIALLKLCVVVLSNIIISNNDCGHIYM